MKNHYQPLPKTLKFYGKRLRLLSNKVDIMKHYWKVRCKERHTLYLKLKKLERILLRMQSLEKNLKLLLNRNNVKMFSPEMHKTKTNFKLYPVFLTHNDIGRLRQFLSYNMYHGFVRYKKNKRLLWLTKKQYQHSRYNFLNGKIK